MLPAVLTVLTAVGHLLANGGRKAGGVDSRRTCDNFARDLLRRNAMVLLLVVRDRSFLEDAVATLIDLVVDAQQDRVVSLDVWRPSRSRRHPGALTAGTVRRVITTMIRTTLEDWFGTASRQRRTFDVRSYTLHLTATRSVDDQIAFRSLSDPSS